MTGALVVDGFTATSAWRSGNGNHPGMQPATQTNSTSYRARDRKWVL